MDYSSLTLVNVVVVAVALLYLYGTVSLIIILTFNCDVATALTPSLRKDKSSPVFKDGAKVWITGAGSGLGERIAYKLAETSKTVKLILSSRKAEHLEKVAAECRRLNSDIEVEILPLDLSDLKSIPDKVQQALKLFGGGKVDVLINGAGVTTRSFSSKSSFELDHYVAKVNYLGPVCLIKNLFPDLPGTIIQLGSIASKMGAPVRSAYSASKFALHGWLEAVCVESVVQGRDLYGLNCILGSIDTGLGARALTDVKDGKVVTMEQEDTNLSAGLDPDYVVERILAVAKQKKRYETWIAKPKELLPILYFVTYFRHTAFLVLSKTIGIKYAVTKKKEKTG